MKEERISTRQFLTLLTTALAAAALRWLPAYSARLVQGEGAWLSVLPALPVVLLLCWVVTALLRDLPGESGLGGALCTVLGRGVGKALTILYIMWMVLIFGSGLVQCAERLGELGYGRLGQVLFLMAALLLSVRMALGRLPAFARATEIFFLLLTGAGGLVLLLALLQVEPENLLPVGWSGGRLLLGGLPALQLACAGVPAAFLVGAQRGEEAGRGRKKLMLWAVWAAVALTVVQVVCVGAFGWQVTAMQRVPLFEAAKQAGLPGAFQRIEAVVAALLVMSDVALFGLALFCLCAMGRTLSRRITPRWTAPVGAVLSAGVGLAMAYDRRAAEFLGQKLLPGASIVLGLLVPVIVLIVKKARKIGRGEGLSCGVEAHETKDVVAASKAQKIQKKKQKKC